MSVLVTDTNMGVKDDKYWMQQALELAMYAKQEGEVPVGAILVLDNQKIAEGWNQPIGQHDPSAHAEVMCLRQAGKVLKNYRLVNTTLYVTLEPCVMCSGALLHARVQRVVFGAFDPKAGGLSGPLNVLENNQFNHRVEVSGGVLEAETLQLLQQFFQERR